jgi:hypothetical protein
MLAKLMTLLIALSASIEVTAAPALDHLLFARECPVKDERSYITLVGHSWIKIEALDKNAQDYYEEIGPFARKFAFYKPDNYVDEHFKLTSYKGEGEWAKMDTVDLQEDGIFDVSGSWSQQQRWQNSR